MNKTHVVPGRRGKERRRFTAHQREIDPTHTPSQVWFPTENGGYWIKNR